MSAGTRSSAMTATAPASSAIFACSGVTTSMITPPLSISAMPRLTRAVPVTGAFTLLSDTPAILRERRSRPDGQSQAGGLLRRPGQSRSGRYAGVEHQVVDVEVA